MNIDEWTHELKHDLDKEFILHGIKQGFKIVDDTNVTNVVEVKNHSSCFSGSNKQRVEALLLSEISNGRLVPVKSKPSTCSPLAAIEKGDGAVRLIFDASLPEHLSLNSYSHIQDKVKYERVQDALDQIEPGVYLSKIDIKSAYRALGIHPSQYHMSGCKWHFEGDKHPTYMVDTRLMMGATKAPSIFHRVSQAVKRCMERRGFKLTVYLDDFLLIGRDYNECLRAQHVLVSLLRTLGFGISWAKLEGPATKLTFLGVEIDTVGMTVGLPKSKVTELSELLLEFSRKKRASCKQLQRLAGKLNWAAQCITSGRGYLRKILDVLAPLRMSRHKARLSREFQQDIDWWLQALSIYPGKSVFYKPPIHIVEFDACSQGAGVVYDRDWCYVDWATDIPSVNNMHINCKEAISAVIAARRWAHLWENSKVVFYTDNMTARACIAKGTTKTPDLLPWIKELHLYSVLYNFDIEAVWLPGSSNIVPDAISRMRFPYLRGWFLTMIGLNELDMFSIYTRLLVHMSNKAFLSIFCQE